MRFAFALIAVMLPSLAVAQSLPAPSVTTQAAADNSNKAASTAFVQASIAASLTSPTFAVASVGSTSAPTVDLITAYQAQGKQAPDNGLFLNGGRAKFLFNPVGGPFLPVGLTAAQNVGFMTTTGSTLLSEFMSSQNMVSATGFPSAWAVSTLYQPYASVVRGGFIYNNVTISGASKASCTSAASGSGPTGTGASIVDGTCLWEYSPTGTPQNGGKVNQYLATYVDDNSNQAWTAVDNLILGGLLGQKINAFTREVDITNNRRDYATGYGGSAVALQVFAGGTRRSSAAIAVGQSAQPTDPASFVHAMTFGGATLASDSTIYDITGSANGFFSQGTHVSSFTDNSTAGHAFNAFGAYSTSAARLGGTAPIGLLLNGAYSAFQVQGGGWNVNPTGVLTAAGGVFNGDVTVSGAFKPHQTTVAGAFPCVTGTKGSMVVFTDVSGTPAYRQTGFAGGGAQAVPGFCNGTSWELH